MFLNNCFIIGTLYEQSSLILYCYHLYFCQCSVLMYKLEKRIINQGNTFCSKPPRLLARFQQIHNTGENLIRAVYLPAVQ